MVVGGREPADDKESAGAFGFMLDGISQSYSQILFNPSRAVGLVLAAATFVAPVTALYGLASVLVALGAARVLQFSTESIRHGLFGYNALLVGLGLGALYEPSLTVFGLLVVASLFSVLATATLNSALGVTFNLPSLTLPFLVVFYLVTALAGQLKGVVPVPFEYSEALQGEMLPHALASYLKCLGAVFFLPRVDAGAFVLLALLLYSRIGFVLSLVGFAVAYPLSLHLVAVPDAPLHLMMGYNLVLVSIALGGVWFVPRPASFLFALVGVLVAAVLTLGGRTILSGMGLSLLILPFNLTVIPMLYAMRQRVRDGSPKAVDFVMGTPEQNLDYYQTRMARFGFLYYVRFELPFLGRWVCTQGNDGEHTHQGQWRHGLDFQVRGPDGNFHKGTGKRVEDYHCFRLPVIAPADGTVVKVVDSVPDNKISEMNTKENWGNYVVTWHGSGLYSLVAHLARASVKVKEGEVVRKGDQLGLCGNSGRSPSPHLHFQLQGTARLGAPTIAASFHEIVLCKEEEEELLEATCLPGKGDVVRNLDPEEDFERLFAFPIGEELRLVSGEGKGETIVSSIDLYGNLRLESKERKAVLFFENKLPTFTIWDYQGSSASLLSLVNLAIPRVPLEPGRKLHWSDHLISRYFYSWGKRMVRDLAAPFLGLGGLRMNYSLERNVGDLVVQGESVQKERGGRPLLTTRAEFTDSEGLTKLEVELYGRRRTAQRAAKP